MLEIDIQANRSNTWIKYARTEVVEVLIFIFIQVENFDTSSHKIENSSIEMR